MNNGLPFTPNDFASAFLIFIKLFVFNMLYAAAAIFVADFYFGISVNRGALQASAANTPK
jgi:hypothetical protein